MTLSSEKGIILSQNVTDDLIIRERMTKKDIVM